MNKTNILIIIIVVLVIGGGLAYASFRQSTKSNGSTDIAGANGYNRSGGLNNGGQPQNGTGSTARRGGANGNFARGKIISKDDTSLTVQSSDNGGSKIVFYSSDTKIMKLQDAAASDLAVGQTVMVQGKKNSDSTIAADSIQLRPADNNTNRPTNTAGAGNAQNGRGQSPQTGAPSNAPAASGQNGGSQNNNSGFVSGQIAAVDGNNLTIKVFNNSTVTVEISGTTKISKFINGSSADLAVGVNVNASGTKNPDGSIASKSIQIGDFLAGMAARAPQN